MTTSPIRRILVAVDFSPCSADGLRLARSLATALGASIEILHVSEPSSTSGGAAESPDTDPDTVRERLNQFARAVEGADATEAARVEQGHAHDRIVFIAEQEGFDLIVMGTHGRTGRAHSFVGSVAESVVRTSTRPVLTVREGSYATSRSAR